MRTVSYCAVVVLLFAACSSNQNSNTDYKNIYSSVKDEPANGQKSSVSQNATNQGKLNDEQVKMYIAVQIKEEQIRYTKEFSQPGSLASSRNKTESIIESEAVNSFDVDPAEYNWVKKTIKRTLSLIGDSRSRRNIINDIRQNAVLMHNITMLRKHRDGLDFAHSYALPSKSSNNASTLSNRTNSENSDIKKDKHVTLSQKLIV